jgi:hypothetical protein
MHHECCITGGTKEIQNGSSICPDNDTFVPYSPDFAATRRDMGAIPYSLQISDL